MYSMSSEHDRLRDVNQQGGLLEIRALAGEELNHLGLTALSQGEHDRARICFAHAALLDERDATIYANLAYTYLLERDFERAAVLYLKAVELEPALAIAYHGLAQAAHGLGNRAAAEQYRTCGLTLRPVTMLRYTGSVQPIDLLLLGSASDANIVTRNMFPTNTYRVHALAVEYFRDEMHLPNHDIVFNAIGEADMAGAALERAALILQRSSARVINHPERVLKTGRINISKLLANIEGVRSARIARLSGGDLAPARLEQTLQDHKLTYPFLLRSPGHHSGEHFLWIASRADIGVALRELVGEEYFAIEFLNARAADGMVRKYRVLFIDGRCYPIHLAIAPQWKVHYFNAQTMLQTQYRNEEASYLSDMQKCFGDDVLRRMMQIQEHLGLQYGGMDFGFDNAGTLLVFEANATMSSIPSPNETLSEERRRALKNADDAMQAMLRRYATLRHSIPHCSVGASVQAGR